MITSYVGEITLNPYFSTSISFSSAPDPNVYACIGSDTNGPRKAVPNKNCIRMGIRINPYETAYSIISFFNLR